MASPTSSKRTRIGTRGAEILGIILSAYILTMGMILASLHDRLPLPQITPNPTDFPMPKKIGQNPPISQDNPPVSHILPSIPALAQKHRPAGNLGRTQSTAPGVGKGDRKILLGMRGCHQIKVQSEKCCDFKDGRTDEEFGYQDCVPAKSKFASGNACEPASWVRKEKQSAVTCPENPINWNQPKNKPKPASRTPSRGAPSVNNFLSKMNAVDACRLAMGPEGFKRKWNICTKNAKDKQSNGYCMHNEATQGTYCRFKYLSIDKRKINVAEGGEEIKQVMGRAESREFPAYSTGAFQLSCKEDRDAASYKLSTQYYLHHHKLVMQALTYQPEDQTCMPGSVGVVEGVSIMFTRYEYANLFHQMTDWYNLYVVGSKENVLMQPVTFIFLDGHSKSVLDSAWDSFSSGAGFLRVKQLPSDQTCFGDAILMPMGYRSPVDIHSMNAFTKRCEADERVGGFRTMARNILHIPDPIPGNLVRVGIIFRKDYIAHPRSKGKASRKIVNEKEVSDALRGIQGISLEVLLLETMSFADQVKKIVNLNILIGVHGAALSYSLWMNQNSDLIEISPSGYAGRQHFEYHAKWAGVRYTKIGLPGGELIKVNCDQLVRKVKRLMKNHNR